MNRGVVVALGLTLVVAESAMAQSLPTVPVPEVRGCRSCRARAGAARRAGGPVRPGGPGRPAVPAPPVVTHQLPALLPTAPQPSGGTSAPSVSRAAPSGSGGRSAPTAAASTPPTRAAQPAACGGATGVQSRRGARAAAAQRWLAAGAAARAAAAPHGGRLRACLDGLPTLERRVLVLRAGLGPRQPRARARVARALDLSARRVRRLERRGLRRLRGLARGGCGGGAPAPIARRPPEPPRRLRPRGVRGGDVRRR